jgi:hypothetical protein
VREGRLKQSRKESKAHTACGHALPCPHAWVDFLGRICMKGISEVLNRESDRKRNRYIYIEV